MAESIRYFFDQHVPSAVAHALELRHVDVLTAQAAGRCGLPDSDQLQFSAGQRRVVMTFDTDYLVLAASGMPHAGIAWCLATKYSVGELIQMLLLLHGVVNADEMHNRVEYL